MVFVAVMLQSPSVAFEPLPRTSHHPQRPRTSSQRSAVRHMKSDDRNSPQRRYLASGVSDPTAEREQGAWASAAIIHRLLVGQGIAADIASGECAARPPTLRPEMPIGSRRAAGASGAGPHKMWWVPRPRLCIRNHCGAGLRAMSDVCRWASPTRCTDWSVSPSRGVRCAPRSSGATRAPWRSEPKRWKVSGGVLSGRIRSTHRQLHRVETGVGQAQRTRRIRADTIHAPRRLSPTAFRDVCPPPSAAFRADTWDFEEERPDFVAGWYGIPQEMIPGSPRLDRHGGPRTDEAAERLLASSAGTLISLPRRGPAQQRLFTQRHGGGRSATGGTAAWYTARYGQTLADPQSRVNTFVHVNHRPAIPVTRILACINGTGIMNCGYAATSPWRCSIRRR